MIRPDPCFGLRLCDLERGYALTAEGCEITQVKVQGGEAQVSVRTMEGQTPLLRLRTRVQGQWQELTVTEGEASFSL